MSLVFAAMLCFFGRALEVSNNSREVSKKRDACRRVPRDDGVLGKETSEKIIPEKRDASTCRLALVSPPTLHTHKKSAPHVSPSMPSVLEEAPPARAVGRGNLNYTEHRRPCVSFSPHFAACFPFLSTLVRSLCLSLVLVLPPQ